MPYRTPPEDPASRRAYKELRLERIAMLTKRKELQNRLDSNAQQIYEALGMEKVSKLGYGRATRLFYARHALDLSQQELADLAGISRATVIKLESGDQRYTEYTLKKISAALNMPPDWLLCMDVTHPMEDKEE